jgi:luciferase family oxidoreductase group 1
MASVEHYGDQLMDLYGYLADDLPPDHPFAGIKAMPAGETLPELWVLGSSLAGAQYAAEFGWSFCFAHFINAEGGDRAMALYRERFKPSPFLSAPRGCLAVSATVAETEAEAERLSWSRWGWRIMAQKGDRAGIPTPEEAIAFDYTPAERDYLLYVKSRSLYGDPGQVRGRIAQLAQEYGVEEVVVVTITHDFASRVRSYELLAGAFGLAPRED